MSRIGKVPIVFPETVKVEFNDSALTIAGGNGSMTLWLSSLLRFNFHDKTLAITPKNNSKSSRAMWGTTAALIKSAIVGVTQGHSHALELIGVGYRASVEGQQLLLSLGFSHETRIPIPSHITVKVGGDRNRPVLTLSSFDKQALGQFVARIRRLRPPEPYKGKGIRFAGEAVRRKEGKRK